MQLDESQLRSVGEARTLYRLGNGIEIVRRKKHEPLDSEDLTRDVLERKTESRSGSKFLRGTTLKQIVEMTAELLLANRARVGSNKAYNRVYPQPIGISRGEKVRAFRVELKGRWAHGYPVDERAL